MNTGPSIIAFLVMMAVNLNIAFISPPVGFSLFYLQSVKPAEVKTIDIHRGALPFVGLQLIALVVVMLWLYIGAYVTVAGADLNAELERQTHGTRPRGPRSYGST